MRKTFRIIVITAFPQFLDHLNGRVVFLAVFFLTLVDDHFIEFNTRWRQVDEHDTPLPRLDVHILGPIAHGSDV